MKYFIDTEFIDDGKTIDLISIGIVAEDGREFYREVWPAKTDRASPWVKEHVLPHLVHLNHGEHVSWDDFPSCPQSYRGSIAVGIQEFVAPDRHGPPEFWGYYADYDWVALCQLFGTMMDLPKGWPMYAMDLKQWAIMLGNPELPSQGKGEHHALADARWNKAAWEFLRGLTS